MTTAKRVGKYEITEQVGVGGFGIVYKAWDPFIQRWVALKTCNATEPDATQRFFREAQLAGALQHPNITLIYDFGVDGDTPYFVQEFLTGTDLDDLMASRKLTMDGILAVLLQVCSGLEYAHSRGIVHRDIKPANVRVLEDGTVKIMDFGIAKSLENETQLTQTGVALGTAGYLAPEQLSGRPLDPRTDLFALGVLAYEMVTGARPFAGANLSNVIYQILNQEPVPPRQRNPGCPERLERAILKTLAKEPDDRFTNVREFATELKEILATLPPRGQARRPETTTAMVREELARLAAQPGSQPTAATQLAARPLDRIATGPSVPEAKGRRGRTLAILGAFLAVAIGGAAWLYLSGAGFSDRAGTPMGRSNPRSLVAPPVVPTFAPTPAPTAVPTPARVEVELFADPPADVTVDGNPLGRVQSTRVTLTVGRHTIRQRIPGYREATREVEVTGAGQTIALRLPPFGLLTVVNDFGAPVQGARVYLDGKLIGSLPVLDRKVEAGGHELRVTWPDGSEYRDHLDIAAEGTQTKVVRPH
jgi:eukaryotic-like serine/threonine-protein kinase